MQIGPLFSLPSVNSSLFSLITDFPSKIVMLFKKTLGYQEKQAPPLPLKISSEQETKGLITHLSRLGRRHSAWETESYMSATLQALLSIDKVAKKVWTINNPRPKDAASISYFSDIATYVESHGWQPYHECNRRFTQADPYIFLQYLLPKLNLTSLTLRKKISYPVATKDLHYHVFDANNIPDIVAIGVERQHWKLPVTLSPQLSIPVFGRAPAQFTLKAVVVYNTALNAINGYYTAFISEEKEWVECSEQDIRRYTQSDRVSTQMLQNHGYLMLYA